MIEREKRRDIREMQEILNRDKKKRSLIFNVALAHFKFVVLLLCSCDVWLWGYRPISLIKASLIYDSASAAAILCCYLSLKHTLLALCV